MLQNRVDPWGKLHATSERGTLMGNRGILHGPDRTVLRESAHQHWVSCLLEFGGRRRPTPFSTTDNYSELFFLDEATAFSAGHRPCHHCQRERSTGFKAAWLSANPRGNGFVSLHQIDKALHRERVDRERKKRRFEQTLGTLPVGTVFEHAGHACLVSPRGALPWSFRGYEQPMAIAAHSAVQVLTPESVVRAFAAGFVPHLHTSAT